jgi:aldose 1-epimerase
VTHSATRVIRPSGQQIEIAHADQQAVIVEVGGGLRTYTASGRELLDGTSGRGQVLIPWPNRLRHGNYTFEGERHQPPINDVAERNAIHGLVRWAGWTVAEREPHRVVMQHLVHSRPGYPFSLLLAIDYQLSQDGLRVQTTATNRWPTACPFGSGAHSYLTVGTETVDSVILSAPGRTVLRSDERGIPVGAEAVDDTDYDFRRPRPIGDARLDNALPTSSVTTTASLASGSATRTGVARLRSGLTRPTRT